MLYMSNGKHHELLIRMKDVMCGNSPLDSFLHSVTCYFSLCSFGNVYKHLLGPCTVLG